LKQYKLFKFSQNLIVRKNESKLPLYIFFDIDIYCIMYKLKLGIVNNVSS